MSDETFDPTQTTAGLQIPEMSLDATLEDVGQPFLGVVVLDTFQPNFNQNGMNWVLGIRPIDFMIRGELGCFFNRVAPSISPNSKCGATLEALQKVFGKQKLALGKGQMKTWAAVWVRKTLEFGTDKSGKPMRGQVYLAVRKPDAEELLRCKPIIDAIQAGTPLPQKPEEAGAAPEQESPAAAVTQGFLANAEEMAKIIAVLDGKAPSEFQLAAIQSGLPPALMNGLLNGTALAELLKSGAVTQDADGVVHAAATTADIF